jgi:serine/threonine protein kinase
VQDRVIWGGKYAIFGEIASGGMATVYLAARLARSSDIPAVVALKKLSAQLAKQPEFVAMFLDEAHLAARIRHPNVVTTYEFLRTGEGLGIVMDFVVGESFVELLRGLAEEMEYTPLPIAAAIVAGALEGLHAAHETRDDAGRPLGLVHRDVSPHNILVGADGVARVIDFGIAKAAGRLQTTDVGIIKGKFAYMAPEQIQGAAVDATTDVYAAGIVLWEALAGRKLFRAASNEELLIQRSRGSVTIPPPRAMNSGVPHGLERVVLRALETDPRDRYATAQAMAAALRSEIDLADATTVAAWVRGRAGARLEMLEEARSEIFASMASTLAESPGPRAPSPRSGEPPASVAPLVDIPEEMELVPRTPGLHGTKPSALSPAQAAPTAGTPSTPPKRAAFAEEIVLGGGVAAEEAPLSIELAAPRASLPPARSRTSMPPASSTRRPLASRPPLRAHTSKWRSFGGVTSVVTILVVVSLGGVAFWRGPDVLKGHVIASAAEHGVSLTVDQAEPTRAGLELTGVKLALVGCPGVTLSAGEVEVDLDHFGRVQHVTVPGFELFVQGTVSEVAAQVDAWRKAHRALFHVEGRSGHLVWVNAVTPAVMLEALGVSFAMADAPEPTISLDTASLLISLPRGHVGPWHAHLDTSPDETRVRLGFDAASPAAPPSATFVARPLDGETWSLDIPRASTFKIGVPGELLGVASDLSVEVGLRAHLASTGKALTVEGHVGLYGLQAASARGTPVDLAVSGRVSGDPAQPLSIQGGRLEIGKSTSAVSGTLTVAKDGLRVAIDRPSLHPSSRDAAGPPLILDTRDWSNP